MKKWWISGSAVLALGGAAAMATPSYTAVFLPTDGMTGTYAEGITDSGQIVGWSTSAGAALLWQSPSSEPTNLNPAGYASSQAFAIDGSLIVGVGDPGTGGTVALAWQGTTPSVLAVPAGYTNVVAVRTADGQIIGGASTSTSSNHALVWTSPTATAIDINPSGYEQSAVYGTDGTQEVGVGTDSEGNSHALIWTGTSNAALELTASGYTELTASGISNNLISGSGSPGTGRLDALLWNISDGTFVDLDPTGGHSEAYAIAGNFEAGYIWADGGEQAAVWQGTADSLIDLDSYLPSNLQSAFSIAFGVDQHGDVVGEVDTSLGAQAVLWLAPEPASLSIGAVGWLFATRRKKNRS